MKAELRRLELTGAAHLLARWRTRQRHWEDLQSLSGVATAAAAADGSQMKPHIAPLRLELELEDGEEEEDDPAHYSLVVCPPHKRVGQLTAVETPEGKVVQVEIPKGVAPGGEFEAFVGPRHLCHLPGRTRHGRLVQSAAKKKKKKRNGASTPQPEEEKEEEEEGEAAEVRIVVVCPEGVSAGGYVLVEAPNGREIEVQIPDGTVSSLAVRSLPVNSRSFL